MKYIDLTHTFTETMPQFPGDPHATLKLFTTIEESGYTDHRIECNMHVGTHIDAPLHFVPNGERIPDIAPEKFVGRGVLIDVRGIDDIPASVLDGKQIDKGDIVLFFSDYSQNFKKEGYFDNHAVLSTELAQRLVEAKVSVVGLDWPSPDKDPFDIHKILLGAEVLIIENLTNLAALEKYPELKL